MEKISFFTFFLFGVLSNAQVGINTTTPEATLDVNGNLMVRQVDDANPSANYNFLVLN